jgi:hypothetical protein
MGLVHGTCIQYTVYPSINNQLTSGLCKSLQYKGGGKTHALIIVKDSLDGGRGLVST